MGATTVVRRQRILVDRFAALSYVAQRAALYLARGDTPRSIRTLIGEDGSAPGWVDYGTLGMFTLCDASAHEPLPPVPT